MKNKQNNCFRRLQAKKEDMKLKKEEKKIHHDDFQLLQGLFDKKKMRQK